MIDAFRRAVTTAKTCVTQISPDVKMPSDECIKAAAKIAFQTAKIFFGPDSVPEFTEADIVECLKKDYIHYLPPWQILDEDESSSKHEKWLSSETKNDLHWQYWERYEQLLYKNGNIPKRVIDDLGLLTDDILGRLESPDRPGPWDRRGLVVGEVQAGKTGNYIGLICKAIDAGYKTIVVLAGLHKNLRSQTQLRIDAGIRGRTKTGVSGEEILGVGCLSGWNVNRAVHYLTDSSDMGDFKVTRVAGVQIGSDPVVLVVKKNKSILENVHDWISRNDTTHGSFPFLLIDDEADNASINTRSGLEEDARDNTEDLTEEEIEQIHKKNITTINRLIRKLLKLSDRTAYVGYTATPQANLFIDPDAQAGAAGADLFPESFIVNISSPTNYFGPEKVFGFDTDEACGISGAEGLPIIREVLDHEDDAFFPPKHKKAHIPSSLPPSLRRAIRSFILTVAARRARGQGDQHNSMLIHVTRFVDVQAHVKELVQDELSDLRMRIRHGDGGSKNEIMAELKELWDEDYVPTSEAMSSNTDNTKLAWKNVLPEIKPAVDQIAEVREINGRAKDVLNYSDHKGGLSVIAIGGDKLSRGLTLEGLSVSYYLRSTQMYDTLMQMGRWFGYRPGYEDLCRLYTTPDLIKCYRGVAQADFELRREFVRMNEVGGTPADYGLKVRSGVNGMLVTALNRMRHGREVNLTFADYTAQLPYFSKDNDIAKHNFELTEKFLSELPSPDRATESPHLFWKGVDASEIIRFASNFKCCAKAFRVDARRIADYIKTQNQHGNLKKWDVALVNIAKKAKFGRGLLGEVGMSERSDDPKSKDSSIFSVVKGTLLDPGFESIGLTPEERLTAETLTREHMERAGKKYSYPLSEYIRTVRGFRNPPEGLLQLYVLNPSPAGVDHPLIGYGFTFPPLVKDKPVSYMVGKVWLKAVQLELGIDEI